MVFSFIIDHTVINTAFPHKIVVFQEQKLIFIKKKKKNLQIEMLLRGFPGCPVVKNMPMYAGDIGSIPDLGRSHMIWSN